MPFRVSKAFVLCIGLLWTNKVSALSLSESVPDWIIFERKLASDEDELKDEEVWKVWVSVSCSVEAFVVREARSVGDNAGGVDDDDGESGGIDECHSALGWQMKRDFGLSDTLVGSWTFGGSIEGSGSAGAGSGPFGKRGPFSFFDFCGFFGSSVVSASLGTSFWVLFCFLCGFDALSVLCVLCVSDF